MKNTNTQRIIVKILKEDYWVHVLYLISHHLDGWLKLNAGGSLGLGRAKAKNMYNIWNKKLRYIETIQSHKLTKHQHTMNNYEKFKRKLLSSYLIYYHLCGWLKLNAGKAWDSNVTRPSFQHQNVGVNFHPTLKACILSKQKIQIKWILESRTRTLKEY